MTKAVQTAGGLNRWGLVGCVFAATVAISAAILVWHPGLTGVRDIIAFTARGAVLLFCLAFSASSIFRLWPAYRWSRWQIRNRRYLGISFAVVQTIHIAFVITFARVAPEVFVVANGWWGNTILAGLAYAFVVAMGLTSFDRTAAWLGRARWSLLHKVGGYYIWLIFLIAFGKRMLADPYSAYGIATLLLLVTLGLRLTAAAYQRGRPSAKVDPVVSH
jgi:methionine sulfoxide reductase heme-binding subunit